jgi:WD40 repeat protein
MLKLRRTIPLLAVAALGAGALALWGCGKGTSRNEGRRGPKADPADEKAEARRREREKQERNPPQGGVTPYRLYVVDLALSPDGSRLLTSFHVEHRDPSFGPLRSLSLWDTKTGKELWAVLGDTTLGRIHWLPDGKHFLAVAPSRKGRLAVWDATKGVPLRDFGKGTEGEQVLAISADGKRALLSAEGKARVCSLPSGKTVAHLGGANGAALSGALSPDGKWALANFAAYEGSDAMALWQVGKPKPARVWSQDSHWSGGVFSPDGKHVLSSVSVKDKTYAVLWERDSGKELWREEDWGASQFSPDGKQILGVREVKVIRRAFGRLDAATGKPLWSVEVKESGPRFSFSADGRRAAACWGQVRPTETWQITLQVWDATTGKSLRQWLIPKEPPQRQEKP